MVVLSIVPGGRGTTLHKCRKLSIACTFTYMTNIGDWILEELPSTDKKHRASYQ